MKLKRTAVKSTDLSVYETVFSKLLSKYVKENGKNAVVRNVNNLKEEIPGQKAKQKIEQICDKYDYAFCIDCGAAQYSNIKDSFRNFFKEIFGVDVSPAVVKVNDTTYRVITPVDLRLVSFNPQK